MRRFVMIVIATAALVPSAFAQKVKTDYNQSQDMSHYRTYAWKGCAALQNDPVLANGFTARRIQAAVDSQLALKEMRQVPADANPDVYFTCWMGTENKTEVWGSSTPGWGPGWGYGRYGYGGGWGWGGGHTTVNTTHYTEATYVIDMVDTNSEQLVWRSHATMRLGNNNKDAKKIEKMARRAFKKFPAGPAAWSKS
jgi:uncharacterized protein DUF4136